MFLAFLITFHPTKVDSHGAMRLAMTCVVGFAVAVRHRKILMQARAEYDYFLDFAVASNSLPLFTV